MKRHALLIGYTGWDLKNQTQLPGVPVDIQNYKEFLTSIKGGAWYDHEITIVYDKDLNTVKRELLKIKIEDNDLVYIAYSGHGCYSTDKQCRMLEISKNEVIYENELSNLAKRQILIFDCCSGKYSETITESVERKNYAARLEKTSTYEIILARQRYEKLCQQCQEQTLRFYAAKIGDYAHDSDDGGIYTKALLKTLRNEYGEIDMVGAHNKAAQIVQNETQGEQNPDLRVPRLHNFLPGTVKI